MEKNNNNERAAQESGDNKPTTPTSTTPKHIILQKQTSQKGNCLCSPTTHTGSFRCRLHRNPFRRNGNSIGSGLSDLANRSVGSDLSDLRNKAASPRSPCAASSATITKGLIL